MRRLALIALTAALLVLIASASRAASPVVVSDDFNSGGYAGSTGNSGGGGGWTGPWDEIGESDGPAAGAVRVKTASGCSSKCLVVSGSLVYLGSGVSRTAKVPAKGVATLTYSTDFDPLTAAALSVQVNPDGGGWKTLSVRRGTGTFSESVGTIGATLGVRFTVTGLGITGATAIDDIELSFVPDAATTTTIGLPIPPATLPTIPTITIPPATTTTSVAQSTTTTTSSSRSSDSATDRSSDTSTTTTTRAEDRYFAGVAGPPSGNDREATGLGDAAAAQVEPTRDDGVIMHLDPGLMPMAMLSDEDAQVVAGLSVPFGMRTEHLSLDLTLYVILGLTLAVVSALRFELTGRR